MHFPIIEITETKLPENEWASMYSMCEDACIEYETDYIGDPYNKEERQEALKGHITEMFEGVADINYEEESLTFKSREEIITALLKAKRDALDEVLDKINKGYHLFYDFRAAGKLFRGNCSLFWYAGGAQTSAQFIEDAPWFAGKTMYFGNILDAHC